MRTLLLLLLCSFPFLSATAQEEVFVDGIRYELSEEGAVVVVGYYGGEKVVIPDTITYLDAEFKEQRVAVIGIGRDAFYGCTNLTEITIPGSVTSIGEDAFAGCTGLTEITIPGSVDSIKSIFGRGMLGYENTWLKRVTIEDGVTSIGDFAFSGCTGLTKIEVESGNTVYDSRDNCNSIIETASNVLIQGCNNSTIPNSVTSIGEYAFRDCTGLTEITIPNGVTSIGEYAFYGCTGLTEITIPGSVDSIKRIFGNGSMYNTWLKRVTIEDGITSIGEDAFSGCIGLTEITIPGSVTSIGDWAFDGCTGLTKIEVESGNTVYDSRDNCNCIIETASNVLIQGCNNSGLCRFEWVMEVIPSVNIIDHIDKIIHISISSSSSFG